MIDLKGKKILVIGGSRGIGAGVVKVCAQAGADVGVHYSQAKESAERVCKDAMKHGGELFQFQADLREDAAVRGMVRQAWKEMGGLDGVVVSAGILRSSSLLEMSMEEWDDVMQVNLRGTVVATQETARLMDQEQHKGSVVIVTSTSGQLCGGGGMAYPVSKAGQIAFMKGAAKELGCKGIRVNCIAPAWTETDMAAPFIESRGYEEMANQVPLGRLGKASDVGAAAVYLLSDAAEYVTGMTLTVDGGFHMRG